jgi:hypothetical protein
MAQRDLQSGPQTLLISTQKAAMMEGENMHPSDLCPPALALARRVQGLPNMQTYTLTVVKVSTFYSGVSHAVVYQGQVRLQRG